MITWTAKNGEATFYMFPQTGTVPSQHSLCLFCASEQQQQLLVIHADKQLLCSLFFITLFVCLFVLTMLMKVALPCKHVF